MGFYDKQNIKMFNESIEPNNAKKIAKDFYTFCDEANDFMNDYIWKDATAMGKRVFESEWRKAIGGFGKKFGIYLDPENYEIGVEVKGKNSGVKYANLGDDNLFNMVDFDDNDQQQFYDTLSKNLDKVINAESDWLDKYYRKNIKKA